MSDILEDNLYACQFLPGRHRLAGSGSPSGAVGVSIKHVYFF